MKPIKERRIKVSFSADTYSNMLWNFKPQQKSVEIMPGETSLAFYSALNPANTPIVGIATYTVLPIEAAKYFNKIQCFCFEEQRLNPKEEVDLPVFFFIDPEFDHDPQLAECREIILHYTFFEAKKERMMIPGITQSFEDPALLAMPST
ncbi:Cytochrome c oxidase assembly protein cox11, mitochondrial [Cichlidogyrus casuarinus]|uniref:Cytochrome c oxidase assembly protein COX11, mitochondrial n=1 Tax=Cichlidogyrus casuarinus TaxID=1844966 RepID=A0ABD2QED1_9PLAT